MPDFKIALIYFSATNVTKTYAEVIQKELLRRECEAHLTEEMMNEKRSKIITTAWQAAF